MKTERQILGELTRVVCGHVSDAAAARALGVTRGHLSRVLRGQKPMTERLAKRLGYKQVVGYVPASLKE